MPTSSLGTLLAGTRAWIAHPSLYIVFRLFLLATIAVFTDSDIVVTVNTSSLLRVMTLKLSEFLADIFHFSFLCFSFLFTTYIPICSAHPSVVRRITFASVLYTGPLSKNSRVSPTSSHVHSML
jgi:hypothetical protein